MAAAVPHGSDEWLQSLALHSPNPTVTNTLFEQLTQFSSVGRRIFFTAKVIFR
jgi:hypothetical protein